jgi:hypothetical protein
MSDKNAAPAWMLCEELMVDIKEAMVSEAIRTLHGEMNAGRIKLNAEWVNTESGTEELERNMFIINRLIEEAPKMLQAQNEYVVRAEAAGDRLDAKSVENVENVKRLGMAVSYISALMEHIAVIDGWIKSIGEKPNQDSQASILKETLSEERLATVKFVLETKALNRGLLDADELGMLKSLEQG